MWVVWKKVGIFEHFLTTTGVFQPSFEKAQKFSSKPMAEVMAAQKGGMVREYTDESASL